jgi:lipopolysaccharide/colanic/teichoic acid biosynthesis glycosyltransferase
MALHDDKSIVRVVDGVVPALNLDRCVKRLFDIIASTIGLVLLSPVILIVSIAIKIDSGGPIFSHERLYGYKNRTIRVLKFRVTSEVKANKINSRVTRVGRVLRECGIDELPQLFNVLRGDMSIVGPRPYSRSQDLSEYGLMPLLDGVKPGMISLAEVTESRDGFGTMEQRNKDDLYYVENRSLFLDFKVVLMALFSEKLNLNADSKSRRQNTGCT